jgi:hypothetical protein
MPKMRTINEAYNAVKAADPETALSPHRIRAFLLNGDIPCIKAGARYLLDLDTLEAYLKNPAPVAVSEYGTIRKLHEKGG